MARELPTPNQEKQRRPSHEDIARRAYEIYVERGQPLGRDMDNWLEAETQLCAAQSGEKPAITASKSVRASGRSPTSRRS